jgi:hypothetical protein
VWNVRQWSVYQQTVRTNNDVEGRCQFFWIVYVREVKRVNIYMYETIR